MMNTDLIAMNNFSNNESNSHQSIDKIYSKDNHLMNNLNITHSLRGSNNINNPLINHDSNLKDDIIDRDSKLFHSRNSMNEESINLKIKGDKESCIISSIKDIDINVIPIEKKRDVVYLDNHIELNELEEENQFTNKNTNEKFHSSDRRETYTYNNLSINVRGFNYKSAEVFDDNFKKDNFSMSKNRRYNKANVDKGKNFFKMRYIKEKFQELMNMNNKNIVERDLERKDSIKYNNKCKYESTANLNLPLNVILNEDKNAIKFNSLFLQKLEKGIFSFNLKKYEDSYNYLLGSAIVKDETEFGELLLVITGFDKYIVGDFLSREKFPNKKEKKVLNGFMRSMDFRNLKFLEAFRFLLSRLNLPKDSGLILEIIDVYSTVFYEDNKDLGHFKDTNAIYLLSSTVLALNTMFSRSDIVNMKIFKKEDFVKMNTDVDKNILENVYDDLKVNKMDIVYDYNEAIYRRQSLEFNSVRDFYASDNNYKNRKENKDNLNVKDNKDNKDYYLSESNSNEMKGEEIITMLKNGEVFTKYGKYGDPHLRVVKLSNDEKKISWFTLSSCSIFKKVKFIDVSEIKDVYIGVSSSKNFEKFKIPQGYDGNCFSINGIKRSLDLRKDDEVICKKWFHAIKFILKRTKSIAELKNKNNLNLKDFINKKEIVSDIWKTEILPYWHIYRKFVIFKDKGSHIEGLSNFFINKDANKKNKEKFAKIISKNATNNKANEKILDEKDKSEFLYLWTLGIPDWLRKKIWSLIIGNESGVTENLFNFYMVQVENLNFEELIKVLNTSNNVNTTNNIISGNGNNFGNSGSNINNINTNPILSHYNTLSLTSNSHNIIKLKSKLHVSDDPILNEIINDVVKISNNFFAEIKDEKLEFNIFMQDLFKIVRVFTLFRPDITYSKQISYISAILLLNSENYYSAFVCLVNFSISSFVMKFLTRDEIYIRIRLDFLEKLLRTYLPAVYKHFVKMDVTTSLYFFNWMENVFIKYFKYETLLRIWDIYLLKGEVFLYEVGLCIMKIQEKDLIRYTVKDILKNLKKVSLHINEDEFFDMLQEIDISEDYKTLIYENSLAREKGLLFQSFMIEWI